MQTRMCQTCADRPTRRPENDELSQERERERERNGGEGEGERETDGACLIQKSTTLKMFTFPLGVDIELTVGDKEGECGGGERMLVSRDSHTGGEGREEA